MLRHLSGTPGIPPGGKGEAPPFYGIHRDPPVFSLARERRNGVLPIVLGVGAAM